MQLQVRIFIYYDSEDPKYFDYPLIVRLCFYTFFDELTYGVFQQFVYLHSRCTGIPAGCELD